MEDLSYLNPRNPSISFGLRPLQVSKRNLLSVYEHDIPENEFKTEKLKVFLRIKPMLTPQLEQSFEVKSSEILLARTQKVSHEFHFTKIFGGSSNQEQVYNESVHSLVQNFIYGQNCLLFAYGTSSAGKTYTIQGTSDDPGIIPRSIDTVFNSIGVKRVHQTCKYKPDMVSRVIILDERGMQQEIAFKQQIMSWKEENFSGWNSTHSTKSTISQISDASIDKKSDCTSTSVESQGMEFISHTFRDMQTRLNDTSVIVSEQGDLVYSVWVSFAEIYNENIYDLLDPVTSKRLLDPVTSQRQRRQNLALGEDIGGEVYIKGLRHVYVSSGDEAYQVMMFGQHNLKFAPTGLNSVSSRSHCIFTLKLLRHARCSPKLFRVSTFTFCDLAGAERLKNTHNVGERLRESQNINTSLHVLGRCLMTIRDNQKSRGTKLIPFRDSKLTRLFQKALTGKEFLTMIVNVNPKPHLREETFNVLTFSAIAKQIILQPARCKKRVPRSSRFSQYISSHSTLLSISSKEGDITASSVASNTESLHLRNQIDILTRSIDDLNEKLKAERTEKLQIETQIRHELCEQFSSMMVQEQANWESRLQEREARFEQVSDWRVAKLEKYLEKQSRKRQRSDDNSDEEIPQASNTEMEVLKEELKLSNELLQLSKKEKDDISRNCSKLIFELAQCKEELKNAQRIKEAATVSSKGDSNVLISELENQLSSVKEECQKKTDEIKELKGILEDAEVDLKHCEDNLNEAEKERDDMEIKLKEKETELGHNLRALSDKQKILDKQMNNLDSKDEQIENLNKELSEAKEKLKSCNNDSRISELEENILALKDDNELLISKMEDMSKKQKEIEGELLKAQNLEKVHLSEIAELNQNKDDLEDKLTRLEKAQKNTIKEMIHAQNALEESNKMRNDELENSKTEIAKLKLQLQSCMENADFVRSLKEEFESKSSKYEELENENESLKTALQTKEIELEHFKENRDHIVKSYDDLLKKEKEESERNKREIQRYQQMFLKSTPTPSKSEYEAKIRRLNDEITKKDVELKDCYVKLNRLGEIIQKHEERDLLTDDSNIFHASPGSISKSAKSSHRSRRRVDENTHPSLLSDKKQQSSRGKVNDKVTQKDEKKTKRRTRRANLFPGNLDESLELEPIETEDDVPSQSPMRILRSRRM